MKLSTEYVAGFFDADGSASIDCNKSRNYLTSLRVTIANTNKRIIELRLAQFGGYLEVREWCNKKWKTSYFLRLHGLAAEDFIKLISPFVIVKRERVDLALKYIEIRHQPNRTKLIDSYYRVDSRVTEQELLCFTLMQRLNKRGAKDESRS